MPIGMWSWRTLRPLGPVEPRSESLTSDPYKPNPVCSEQRPVHGRGRGVQTLLEKKSHGPGLAAPRWDPDPSPAFGQALGSGEPRGLPAGQTRACRVGGRSALEL